MPPRTRRSAAAPVDDEAAPKPARRRAATATKAPAKTTRTRKLAAVPDDEIDEPAPKPARRTTAAKTAPAKPKQPHPVKGTAWLVDHVNEKTGKDVKSADLRNLLRKMSRDGDLDREIGSGRYSFSGERDSVVRAVVAAVKAGKIERAKKEALTKLKTSAPKGRKRNQPEPEPDEELDDFEDDDELVDDEDVDDLDDED